MNHFGGLTCESGPHVSSIFSRNVCTTDLFKIVQESKVVNPFQVVPMLESDFLDIQQAADQIISTKNLNISKTCSIEYEAGKAGSVSVKQSHDVGENEMAKCRPTKKSEKGYFLRINNEIPPWKRDQVNLPRGVCFCSAEKLFQSSITGVLLKNEKTPSCDSVTQQEITVQQMVVHYKVTEIPLSLYEILKATVTLNKSSAEAYGEFVLPNTRAQRWFKLFKEGRQSISKEGGPSAPVIAHTVENINTAAVIICSREFLDAKRNENTLRKFLKSEEETLFPKIQAEQRNPDGVGLVSSLFALTITVVSYKWYAMGEV
ncbi:hypothetical protein C0J52_12710 [Blattella germanica]|nr:hypothetical protein C0J52_12710 [Blattella germanica]